MRAELGYDARLFSQQAVVAGLGFRLDAGAATGSKQVDLTLYMSAMARGVTGLQAVLGSDPGSGEIQVIDCVI